MSQVANVNADKVASQGKRQAGAGSALAKI
jgi:hypothetical protein